MWEILDRIKGLIKKMLSLSFISWLIVVYGMYKGFIHLDGRWFFGLTVALILGKKYIKYLNGE